MDPPSVGMAETQNKVGGASVKQTIKVYVNVPTQLFSTDLQFPRGVPVNGSVSLIVGNFAKSRTGNDINSLGIEHLIAKQKLIINTPCVDGSPLCIPKPCDDEYSADSFRDTAAPACGTVTLSARHLTDDCDLCINGDVVKDEQVPSPTRDVSCDGHDSSDSGSPGGRALAASDTPGTDTHIPGYGYLLVSDVASSSSDESDSLDEYDRRRKLDQDGESNDKEFSCGICSMGFPTRDLCQKHVWQHIPPLKKEHKCPKCSRTFTAEFCRDWHSKLCKGPKLCCSTCSKEFLLPSALEKHMRTHSKYVYMYCCEYCGWMTATKPFYHNHISRTHQEESNAPSIDVVGLADNGVDVDSLNACLHCLFVGDTLVSLSKHLKEQHPKVELFACPFCSLVFAEKEAVDKHKGDVHRIKIEVRNSKVYYVCPICGKQIGSSVSIFRKHMLKHRYPAEKSFLCSECGAQLSTQESLLHHMRSHDASERTKCSQCQREFPTSYHMRRHFANIHAPNLKHSCPYCARKFSDVTAYKLHLVRIHEVELTEQERRQTQGLWKRCKYCPFTTVCSQIFRKHVDSHTGNHAFRCDLCPRAFSFKHCLDQHCMIAHRKEGGRCKLCRRVFVSNRWFQRHMAMHTDNSGFTCEHCPKMFESEGRLRRHVEDIHSTTPGGYTCQSCGKSFPLPMSLNMHARVVHGERNMSYRQKRCRELSCKECGKTFRFMGSLEAHMVCKHSTEGGTSSALTVQNRACQKQS